MLVSNHTREPASATPPIAAGTSTRMRYHAKVKPTERLSRMFAQISQPESSWSASRAGVEMSCAVSPSLGAPGTSPAATRHSPLTCRRSSALFRSSATLGIGALLSFLIHGRASAGGAPAPGRPAARTPGGAGTVYAGGEARRTVECRPGGPADDRPSAARLPREERRPGQRPHAPLLRVARRRAP